jgi:hypothetical protein
MKWQTDNKVYTLKYRDSRSTYDQWNASDAINHIKLLKASPKSLDGRLNKNTQSKIAHFRRVLRADYPRIYRFVITFKRYKATINFEIEFNPRIHRHLAKLIKEQIRAELGKYRHELRVNTDDYTVMNEHPVKIIGSRFKKPRIYAIPGQFYKIGLKRKVRALYDPKIPTENIKYIGLELEFCAPIPELDFALKLYNLEVHKYAQLKKDGSLRPKLGEMGYELAILLPESNYIRPLRQLCKILEEVGAVAKERRCGLHVHLDMRRRKKDIVYNNLVACQTVFFKFLDPERNDNEFCRLVSSRVFPTKFKNDREERYKTVNAAAYYKYRTLEVRMHEGSVNFKDITNWVRLLVRVANHKTRIKNDIIELTQLKKRIRIDAKMNEFFQDKICFWQLQGPQRRAGAISLDVRGMETSVPPIPRMDVRVFDDESDEREDNV